MGASGGVSAQRAASSRSHTARWAVVDVSLRWERQGVRPAGRGGQVAVGEGLDEGGRVEGEEDDALAPGNAGGAHRAPPFRSGMDGSRPGAMPSTPVAAGPSKSSGRSSRSSASSSSVKSSSSYSVPKTSQSPSR